MRCLWYKNFFFVLNALLVYPGAVVHRSEHSLRKNVSEKNSYDKLKLINKVNLTLINRLTNLKCIHAFIVFYNLNFNYKILASFFHG